MTTHKQNQKFRSTVRQKKKTILLKHILHIHMIRPLQPLDRTPVYAILPKEITLDRSNITISFRGQKRNIWWHSTLREARCSPPLQQILRTFQPWLADKRSHFSCNRCLNGVSTTSTMCHNQSCVKSVPVYRLLDLIGIIQLGNNGTALES